MNETGRSKGEKRAVGFKRTEISESPAKSDAPDWLLFVDPYGAIQFFTSFFSQSPFDRIVVGQRGHWRDLSSSIEQHLQRPRVARPGHQDLLVSEDVNRSLGFTVSELLTAVEPPSARTLVVNAELSAIEVRLARVETQLAKLRGVPEAGRTEREPGAKEAEGQGNPSKTNREDPDVKAALVNLASIASKVNDFALRESPAWAKISSRFPKAKVFAIDADPRSFEVLEQGDFDGRADILLSVPRTLRSGSSTDVSVKIPALVKGKLSPAGEITISSLDVSFH